MRRSRFSDCDHDAGRPISLLQFECGFGKVTTRRCNLGSGFAQSSGMGPSFETSFGQLDVESLLDCLPRIPIRGVFHEVGFDLCHLFLRAYSSYWGDWNVCDVRSMYKGWYDKTNQIVKHPFKLSLYTVTLRGYYNKQSYFRSFVDLK